MVKYVLFDLVRVRTLRKDRVERELMAAKERLVEAEKLVPIREKELEDYRNWVDGEINRLYTEVLRREVHREAIDDLAYNVRAIRGKEPEHVKRVQDAKDDVKKITEELETKKKEVAQAQRDLEKLKSHREEWMAEQAKLEELLGDRELEEAVRQKTQSEADFMDGAEMLA
jgi:chromosome segregation ATPase